MVSQKDIAVDDWDVLFRAVLGRLSQCVGQLGATTAQPQPSDPVALIQTTVLDCVEALNQLHAALKHDRSLIK